MSTGTALRGHARPLAACAGLIALATVLVGSHTATYTTLSPIDELQHIDATLKGGRFQVIRRGEQVSTPALREQSCRGIDSPGFVSPPCDAPVLEPDDYQEGGYNTAAIHPPTYYVVTGVGSGLLRKVIPSVESQVTAARLLGQLWLAMGLLAVYALGRSLGASRRSSFLSAALVGATPAVLFASATVTPDAAALLSGAALAAVTVRHLQGRISAWWLAPAAVVATAFKATGILVVGACTLAVVCYAFIMRSADESGEHGDDQERPWNLTRSFRAVMAIVLGGAIPIVVWTIVASTRSLDAPMDPMSRFDVERLDPGTLMANLLAFLPPTQAPYLPPVLRTSAVASVVGLLGYLLVVAPAGAMLTGERTSAVARSLGLGTLVTMLVGGPLFVVLTYLSAGSYFPVPPRYGLVLVPAAAGILALIATVRRGLEWVMAAVLAAELIAYSAAIGAA